MSTFEFSSVMLRSTFDTVERTLTLALNEILKPYSNGYGSMIIMANMHFQQMTFFMNENDSIKGIFNSAGMRL